MLGLANAWCRKLEEEEMKEEKERRKRKGGKGGRGRGGEGRGRRRGWRGGRGGQRGRRGRTRGRGRKGRRRGRGRSEEERGGGGGGGGGESVENLVRGDSFKAKAEAKPKQSKIHKTRRQAGGFWYQFDMLCFCPCFSIFLILENGGFGMFSKSTKAVLRHGLSDEGLVEKSELVEMLQRQKPFTSGRSTRSNRIKLECKLFGSRFNYITFW